MFTQAVRSIHIVGEVTLLRCDFFAAMHYTSVMISALKMLNTEVGEMLANRKSLPTNPESSINI